MVGGEWFVVSGKSVFRKPSLSSFYFSLYYCLLSFYLLLTTFYLLFTFLLFTFPLTNNLGHSHEWG